MQLLDDVIIIDGYILKNLALSFGRLRRRRRRREGKQNNWNLHAFVSVLAPLGCHSWGGAAGVCHKNPDTFVHNSESSCELHLPGSYRSGIEKFRTDWWARTERLKCTIFCENNWMGASKAARFAFHLCTRNSQTAGLERFVCSSILALCKINAKI